MSFFKTRLLDKALTLYQTFLVILLSLKPLNIWQQTKTVIQKADKCNTGVILDKCSYISVIEKFRNDNSKFSKLDIHAGNEINHMINLEKRSTSELKLLRNKKIVDKSSNESIKTVGSRQGIQYELGKIHKETCNGLPPFRSILSAIGTPTNKVAKLLLQLLPHSTANEYTVMDSFQFAEVICQQDPSLHMASLDIDSLFTNISLDETIDICIDNLYNDHENLPNIPKHDFRNLLNIVTKETFFTFNNIKPMANKTFSIYKLLGIKLLNRLRADFSHLNKDKFRHNLADTLNSLCLCSLETESMTHFFLHCRYYNNICITLMNELNDTDNSITSTQPNELLQVILYGDCKFKDNVNKRILIATIQFIKNSNRFNQSLI